MQVAGFVRVPPHVARVDIVHGVIARDALHGRTEHRVDVARSRRRGHHERVVRVRQVGWRRMTQAVQQTCLRAPQDPECDDGRGSEHDMDEFERGL